ncbi:protein translocase subunit SecDF [Candidatus Mycoplasma pogonae]
MKNLFVKFFKLSNWKRIIILILTISFSIAGIAWGSTSYVSQNINRSVEYGGGVEALIQVKSLDGQKASDETVRNVEKAISDRLTGGTGLNGTNVSIEGDSKILISKNNVSNEEGKNAFIDEIIKKPELSITDINGNPLFYNGVFVENGSLDRTDVSWSPPLKQNSAQARPSASGGNANEVLVSLKDKEAEVEWTKATSYISQKRPNNVILMWVNLRELLKIAQEQYPNEWKNANYNIYNFMFVNEKATKYKQMVGGEEKEFEPVLKEGVFKAQDYLISQASVREPLSGSSFVIGGNFSADEAKQLALNIDYGSAEYKLELLSSNFVSATLGSQALNSALIAGIISFSIIALFLIVNYGLLGALSTISLALYVFLTLLFFTVLRGEYSPSSIAPLIIGIGMSVDANVLMFERFKKEIYEGSNVLKANTKANSLSVSTILNSNITTFLVAIVLFYFGTKSIKGFSITLILSIIFTLVASLLFTRMITTLLIKTGFFNNKLYLLGIQKKYVEKIQQGYIPIIERPNYVKHIKWFNLVPLTIIGIGIIIFIIFAALAGNVGAGFARGIDFSGGTNILIESSNNSFKPLDLATAEEIKTFLINNGIDNGANQITFLPINAEKTLFNVSVVTTQDLTDKITALESNLKNGVSSYLTTNSYAISTEEAQNLVKNAILAISISFILVILYTLIVLKWTFSIAAIVALLHDVIIVIALFVIFRFEFSTIFVAAALTIVGYSINNTIIIFDRIKEITIKKYSHHEVLSKQEIKEIMNSAIKDIMKRSLFTSLTTLITVFMLLIFRESTNLYFNIALLFGIVFGTLSSLFIAPQVWYHLEVLRNKMKAKRMNDNFWNKSKIKEQTFTGINDYNV